MTGADKSTTWFTGAHLGWTIFFVVVVFVIVVFVLGTQSLHPS